MVAAEGMTVDDTGEWGDSAAALAGRVAVHSLEI